MPPDETNPPPSSNPATNPSPKILSKLPITDSQIATVSEHAAALETPDWLFAAAAQKHAWVVGQSLSKTDFETAVQAAATEEVR